MSLDACLDHYRVSEIASTRVYREMGKISHLVIQARIICMFCLKNHINMKTISHENHNFNEILYKNDPDSFSAFKIHQITQFATILNKQIKKPINFASQLVQL